MAAQATRVHERFWIPEPGLSQIQSLLGEWTFGYDGPSWLRGLLVAFLFLGLAVTVLHRGYRLGAIYCVLLASAAWIGCLAVTLLADRPLVQDRYLVSAQIGLFVWVGLATSVLAELHPILRVFSAGQRERVGQAVFAVGMCLALLHVASTLMGALAFSRSFLQPVDPNQVVIRAIRERWQSGDVLCVPGPEELNCMRYWAAQAGWTEIEVRCQYSVPTTGQSSHVASLQPGDMFDNTGELSASFRRVWVVAFDPASSPMSSLGVRPLARYPVQPGDSARVLLLGELPRPSTAAR